MKKVILSIVFYCLLIGRIYSQGLSDFTVRYMVSYDSEKQVFTAWVVPSYDTPNYNNGDSEEKGATAQFTLKVPKGFVVSEIQDIRGSWDKRPTKVGTEEVFAKEGIRSEYYIIGKTPSETNYGAFHKGEPVALFNFRGKGAKPEEVMVVEGNDPFVRVANQKMALNVGNSFYSRSGQKPSASVVPLEQFSNAVFLQHVLAEMNKKGGDEVASADQEGVGTKMELLMYPNPATEAATIKYFLSSEEVASKLELIDVTGRILQTIDWKTKRGVNTTSLNTSKIISGDYKVRLSNSYEVISKSLRIQK